MYGFLKYLMGQGGDLEFHNHMPPPPLFLQTFACNHHVETRNTTKENIMDKETKFNVCKFHLCLSFVCH